MNVSSHEYEHRTKLVAQAIVQERKFIAVATLAAMAVMFAGMTSIQWAIAQTAGGGADVTTFIDTSTLIASAVAGIIGTVIAIATAVVGLVRSTTGDKYITDSANATLQELFKNGKLTDQWLRDELVPGMIAQKEEASAIVGSLKRLFPDKADDIDTAIAEAHKVADGKVRAEVETLDRELDTIYKNLPLIGKKGEA